MIDVITSQTMKYILILVLTVGGFAMTACQTEKQDEQEKADVQPQREQTGKPTGPLPAGLTYVKMVRFAEAFSAIRPKAEQGQKELVRIIESSGLTPEEFNQIQKMRQQPETFNQIPYEPHKKYSDILPKVEEHQAAKEDEMKALVQEYGMSQEEYKDVFIAIQQSQQAQAYFRYIKDSIGIQ